MIFTIWLLHESFFQSTPLNNATAPHEAYKSPGCKTLLQRIPVKKKNCQTAYAKSSYCFGYCSSVTSTYSDIVVFHTKCTVCKPSGTKLKEVRLQCNFGKKIRHKKVRVVSHCSCVEVPCGITEANSTVSN